VSTEKQVVDRQTQMLIEAGAEKIFIDKVSGKNTKREELNKMLDYIREGDTVTVTSYSRFSRSVTDLLSLLETIQSKGADFVSLKENVDTKTPAGRLFVGIIASINAFEREQLLERQKEGIMIAKEKNVKFGRPKYNVDDKFLEAYKEWKSGKIKAIEAYKRIGCSKTTFYKYVKTIENNG